MKIKCKLEISEISHRVNLVIFDANIKLELELPVNMRYTRLIIAKISDKCFYAHSKPNSTNIPSFSLLIGLLHFLVPTHGQNLPPLSLPTPALLQCCWNSNTSWSDPWLGVVGGLVRMLASIFGRYGPAKNGSITIVSGSGRSTRIFSTSFRPSTCTGRSRCWLPERKKKHLHTS